MAVAALLQACAGGRLLCHEVAFRHRVGHQLILRLLLNS